jgi:quercetin dioxygenase-like cupin family protein
MTTDGSVKLAAGSFKTLVPIFWQSATLGVALGILCFAAAGDASSQARHPEELEGAAAIIHKADVVHDRSTNNMAPMRLWPLYSSPDARMNYVEVAGRSGLHFHPDADHKLYVLEGRVVVNAGTNTTIAAAGDLIIIPKGVRHSYDVAAKGDRALLLTFDAPPYDPRKTVNLEPANERK